MNDETRSFFKQDIINAWIEIHQVDFTSLNSVSENREDLRRFLIALGFPDMFDGTRLAYKVPDDE